MAIRMLLAMFLLATAAQAQPVAPACSLVCFPPSHLNAKRCTCEETAPRNPVCSLVCLNPDETLDARKCACVHKR